jgi:hypothetical protein
VAENWIRVRAHLSSAKVALRLAPLCKGGAQHAAGVLQDFWSSVKDNTPNGFIADADDRMLEAWALWTGKRGAFAAWVREHHMDADGRVKEWDEYMGELELRRAKAREKKARQRASRRGNEPETSGGSGSDVPGDKPGDTTPPVPGDVPGTSPSYGTERNGTVRNGGTEKKIVVSSARENSGRLMLLNALGPTQRRAMEASLDVWAQGDELPNDAPKRAPTDAELDRACREATASVQAGQISANIVRTYLARVMRGDPERRSTPRGSGHDSLYDALKGGGTS